MSVEAAAATPVIDQVSETDVYSRLLGWPLTVVAALVCLVLLAGWLPNYLNWPWYSDHDHFATTAQLWEAGRRPYTDVFSFNFRVRFICFGALARCLAGETQSHSMLATRASCSLLGAFSWVGVAASWAG